MKSGRITFLLIGLLASGTLAGQTLHAFAKLSCPEKRWVLFHPFVAKKAFRISLEARQQAASLVISDTLDRDADGGQVDAFRHAYWMARLSQEICWRKARRLGKAHERGNFLDFKHGRTGEETFTDSVASAMDIFNNEAGIARGRQYRNRPPNELRQQIIADIRAGEMKIILKNRQGASLDCDHRPLDLRNFQHVWRIPRCLVSSDTGRE